MMRGSGQRQQLQHVASHHLVAAGAYSRYSVLQQGLQLSGLFISYFGGTFGALGLRGTRTPRSGLDCARRASRNNIRLTSTFRVSTSGPREVTS